MKRGALWRNAGDARNLHRLGGAVIGDLLCYEGPKIDRRLLVASSRVPGVDWIRVSDRIRSRRRQRRNGNGKVYAVERRSHNWRRQRRRGCSWTSQRKAHLGRVYEECRIGFYAAEDHGAKRNWDSRRAWDRICKREVRWGFGRRQLARTGRSCAVATSDNGGEGKRKQSD